MFGLVKSSAAPEYYEDSAVIAYRIQETEGSPRQDCAQDHHQRW